MAYAVISKDGLHYRESGKSHITAFYVPSQDQVKTFFDSSDATPKEVADRYGVTDKKPIFRFLGDKVTVYGSLPTEIEGWQNGVQVFLPQDFAPTTAQAFYYVFENGTVVHGVRVNVDSEVEEWAISRFHYQEKELVDKITANISDRILEMDGADIFCAVQSKGVVFNQLKASVSVLNIDVTTFKSFERRLGIQPLYQHKDHSIFMLITLFLFVVLFCLAGFYLARNYLLLEDLNDEISRLESDIKRVQQDVILEKVSNPRQILDIIEQDFATQPSAVLHAAGEAASELGELQSLVIDLEENPSSNKDSLIVSAVVDDALYDRLIEQEAAALRVVESKSWIRSIKRPGRGLDAKRLTLLIEVQVD